MTTTTNPENLRLNKRRFFLIVEQILVFPSSNKLVRKVKNFSPDFKQTRKRCFTLKIILIPIHFIVKL